MNNLVSYGLFLGIMAPIILRVGWLCYTNGGHYIEAIFLDANLSSKINKLLLMAYYLVNLGYVFYSISTWPTIQHSLQGAEVLVHFIASLLIMLGLLHYINVFGLKYLSLFIKQQKIKR